MLACLKGISGFAAFLILLVGVGMTAITIYGYSHSEIFLTDSQSKTILGIMIAADVLIILGSIVGIYGVKKGNALMICVFQILVIIFLITFFSLGIAAQILPSKFFEGDCANPQNPTLQLARNTSIKAIQSFCTYLPFGGCTCNLKAETVKKYSDIEQVYLKLYNNTNQNDGNSRFYDCPNTALFNITQQERNMGKALGAIQELFQCSGWCDNIIPLNLIYRFSDVNKGRPVDYCYNHLKDEVGKYSNVVGIGALLTAAFLFLVCIINTCICCHPSRKGLKFKDRFVYMKDGAYEKI